MDFSKYPDYPRYRGMRLLSPLMTGFDVYALQTALSAEGYNVGAADGYFGQMTLAVVKEFQTDQKITVDGIAGLETQRRICQKFFTRFRNEYDLPRMAMHGQVEYESSFWLGNYSTARKDGSYDAGVAQMNTAHTSAKIGFNVPVSLEALAENISKYYANFVGVTDRRRRWALAQGTWNAPAYACYIANEEGAHIPQNQTAKPSAESRAKLESYIAEVSKYLSI